MTGGGVEENKVGDGGDDNAEDEEEGSGDHYVLSIELVDGHPPERKRALKSTIVKRRFEGDLKPAMTRELEIHHDGERT
ncbi:hypothetical protein GW17_00040758 [Ensete ventricosum]|nr:hypothetical protein GW17_00040758 [Ensete ventricosum]